MERGRSFKKPLPAAVHRVDCRRRAAPAAASTAHISEHFIIASLTLHSLANLWWLRFKSDKEDRFHNEIGPSR